MKNSISRFIKYVGSNIAGLNRYGFDSLKHAKTYSVIEDITSILDKETHETLLNTVVIMDVSDLFDSIDSALHPIDDPNSTGQILSSLILAYPEVYWIILGSCYNKPANYHDWLDEHHAYATNMMGCVRLLKRHINGYRTLFDPSGLRTWLKEKTIKDENSERLQDDAFKKSEDILEKRKGNCAVAIDEELPYTFLNGYTAYRLGYRCFIITTEKEMEEVLGKTSKVKCDISLEDLDLRFSDTPQSENLNDVYLRKKDYPKLPCNEKRFIITGYSGNTPKGQCKIISKPYAGIYDLKDEIAERVPELQETKSKAASDKNLSLGKQVSFLICHLDNNTNGIKHESRPENNKEGSHGAPNKILILVDHLLDRTRKIISNASSCQEAVHAALLALEAKELLHGQSMTTALEALSSQHKMEVKAECSFYGVAHGIKIKPRFDEIAKDVDVVVRNNEPSKKLCQSYDAQINILNNFRSVFKYHDQFDEEDQCLDMNRRLLQGLHFFQKLEKLQKLQIQNCFCRRLKYFVRYSCIERYINHLIRSPLNLIRCIMKWGISYCFIYFVCNIIYRYVLNSNSDLILTCFIKSISQSFLAFFTVGLTYNNLLNGSKLLNFFTITEIIVAYFHLGIFVAYIYQKISRR